MELGCRFSPYATSLPPDVFQSVACAHCLFYIYFVTPPYSQNYETSFCGSDGLLICPRVTEAADGVHDNVDKPVDASNEQVLRALDDGDVAFRQKNCTCESSPEQVYNHPKFAFRSSTSSIENLSLTPGQPADFTLIIQHCCEAAVRCCKNVLLEDSRPVDGRQRPRRAKATKSTTNRSSFNDYDNYFIMLFNDFSSHLTLPPLCPATWDGWHCFERSEPGDFSASCPDYIFGDRIRNDIDGMMAVRKTCMPDGRWYAVARRARTPAAEWTDYSRCVSNRAYTLKLFAGLLSFGATVVAIIPAIVVFSLHRSLHAQPMFIIHRHLLYSFLFSGIFYIFNCLVFAIDGAPGDHLYFNNHLSCRLLFTIQLRYFRLSTFSWMLGEGVYLYRLLLCTFSSGIESLQPYFAACWGIPLVITVVYSMLREAFDNEECWITPSEIWPIEWTIIGPCLAALSINLMLMLVIFCVLLKKLRFNPNLEPAQYTKAVRAVFMLVPVFGLHSLITIYRIQSYLHQIINLVLDGLQGFMVVLIVFYTNRIVIEAIRSWVQIKRDERKLRKQSEDNKMRFKRSIQERHTGESLNSSHAARFSRVSSQHLFQGRPS